MNKRGIGSSFGGDEARYGGGGGAQEQEDDRPAKATAAQMAKRKIAAAKTRRPRSESPAVFGDTSTSTSFGQSFAAPQASSFTFGENTNAPIFGSAVQPPSTNGTSTGNIFGQSSSTFGNPFGTAPQNNGAAPSTSSIFNFSQTSNTPAFGNAQVTQNGNSTAQSSGSIFGGFGSTPAAQNGNGISSSTSTTQTPAPSNPFAGFNSKPQESSTSLFSNTNSDSSTPKFGNGNLFGNGSTFGQQPSETPKPATGNIFSSIGQNKPAESQTPKTSNMFGGAAQAPSTSNIFGAASQVTQGDSQQPKPAGETTNIFGAPAATPKPSTGSIFGSFNQSSQQDSQASKPPATTTNIFGSAASQSDSQTPKPAPTTANIFGPAATSSQPTTSNIFGSNNTPSQSSGPTQDPSATTSLFSAAKDTAKANTATPSLFNGINAAKESETTSEAGASIFDSVRKVNKMPHNLFTAGQEAATPAKSGNIFGSTGSNDTANGTSTQTQATATKSLFSGFGQSNETQPSESTPKPASNLFNFPSATPQAKTPSFSFGAAAKETISTPATTQTPSFLPNGTTPKDAAPASLFQRKAAEETPVASQQTSVSKEATSSNEGTATPQPVSAFKPATSFFNFGSAKESAATTTPQPQPAPSNIFASAAKTGNAPSSAPAAAAAPVAAAPPVFKTTAAAPSTPAPQKGLSPAQKKSFKHLNRAFLAQLQHQDVDADWTSFLQYYAAQAAIIQKKPAPDLSSGASQANAASSAAHVGTRTPSANTSSSGAFSSTVPATAPQPEKRKLTEASYPKLSENASSTSKLFAAALDKSKSVAEPASTSNAGSTASSLFSATPAQPPSTAPTFGGFKTSTTAPSGASSSATAPSSGFKPTFSVAPVTGSNALAAFGQSAKKAEDDAREKRRLEDYDSDDETPEEWEKRDREKQEAARKELEEAAKNAKGFVLPGTAAATSKPAEAARSSLFAAATPSKPATSAASDTPAGPTPAGNLFGFLSKPAEANKPTSLFSGAQTASLFSTPSASAASAAPKFNFGTSTPATTTAPAATPSTSTQAAGAGSTEDANDDNNDEEEAHEPPADLSALMPEEKENQEIQFELPAERKCRTYAVETNKEGKKLPVSKGIGKPYVLKSKITGRSRLLFKIDTGKAVMNYDVVKGGKYGVTKKTVFGPFLDHIYSKEPRLTQFQMNFSSEELANQMLQVLVEAAL